MFGISFFSNRVWLRLAKMGWKPVSLPPMMTFKLLCDALKANGYNGYNADAAAELWDRVLQGDKEAAMELRDNAGVYGMMHISEDGIWQA